ncbi:MAG TPA: type II toxin-antitoxin system prevent-host-death family antitoxin [Actinomycetota bacterium]|jgi:prevent-host-death family protein|nr:type II toxin-antitoxin system prevent-host-death family antitoxin [Actinomycetota bacterium]
MSEVASRELRNNTRALLDRVEAGEAVTITVAGRPVAVLRPLPRRERWLSREEFVRTIAAHQADPGLTAELRELAGETTDDLPFG